MPGFAVHSSVGACVGAAFGVAAYNNFGCSMNLSVATGVTAWLFSIFPDIDIKSKASKIFYTIFLAVMVAAFAYKKYVMGNIIGMLACLPQLANHRGVFHSPVMAFVLGLMPVVYGFSTGTHAVESIYVSAAVITGYFTHLVLDGWFHN
jgi:Predicted membrane-bound metal-dependent hydrolase (DUF457).